MNGRGKSRIICSWPAIGFWSANSTLALAQLNQSHEQIPQRSEPLLPLHLHQVTNGVWNRLSDTTLTADSLRATGNFNKLTLAVKLTTLEVPSPLHILSAKQSSHILSLSASSKPSASQYVLASLLFRGFSHRIAQIIKAACFCHVSIVAV